MLNLGPYRGGLDGLIPALQLAVRLRLVGRGADMRHAAEPDEVPKVASDELRPVVGNHVRVRVGEFLSGA